MKLLLSVIIAFGFFTVTMADAQQVRTGPHKGDAVRTGPGKSNRGHQTWIVRKGGYGWGQTRRW